MDFRLSEEEKLIRETAAQFVAKEMITREGDYLRQGELFLPPGDPPRRELDATARVRFTGEIARRIGLWALELPETSRRANHERSGTGIDSSRVWPNHVCHSCRFPFLA